MTLLETVVTFMMIIPRAETTVRTKNNVTDKRNIGNYIDTSYIIIKNGIVMFATGENKMFVLCRRLISKSAL